MIDNFEIFKTELAKFNNKKLGTFYPIVITPKEVDSEGRKISSYRFIYSGEGFDKKRSIIINECRKKNAIAEVKCGKDDYWIINISEKQLPNLNKEQLNLLKKNCTHIWINDIFNELTFSERLSQDIIEYINKECSYNDEEVKNLETKIIKVNSNKDNVVIITKCFNLKKFKKLFPFIDVNILFKE